MRKVMVVLGAVLLLAACSSSGGPNRESRDGDSDDELAFAGGDKNDGRPSGS